MTKPSRQSSVPVSALCAESRIRDISLKIKNTPLGGSLLGTVKPTWKKALIDSQLKLCNNCITIFRPTNRIFNKSKSIGKSLDDFVVE